MEHFAKDLQVISPKRLRDLSQKSNKEGWIKTGSHIGAIILNTALLSHFWGHWLGVVFFVIQGVLLACLYAGIHEFSHRTVFKTKELNDLFGRLFSFTILVCKSLDRSEHMEHHRYTQDLKKDAELIGTKPFTLTTYLLYVLGPSYWFIRIRELVYLTLGINIWPYLSEKQYKDAQREVRENMVGYLIILIISVWFQSWAAIQFWLLPLFIMKWVHQLQNITEHTGMPNEAGILINTRTIKTNAVMRWLMWNMQYHTAHHLYPSVPFFRLPALHQEIFGTLEKEPPTITYQAFQWHMIRKLIADKSSRFCGRDVATY
ncbi:fatty acid desaturase [Hyphococcus sp. DH-69]|uniref:fatty acid desaturase n=1 Tax=Hyphococcus formosus TaxID=3143534 RepID=UPI00398B266B